MLRQILSASGFTFSLLGVLMSAGIASATAPIDIDVPLPHCENGKPRNANNECPGNGDGIFQLPKTMPEPSPTVPSPPRGDLDARGSGRNQKSKPTENNPSCEIPEGAQPLNWCKSQDKHQDPDMGDREGVPPSAGTGTRMTQDEVDYWRLINGGKTMFKPPIDNPKPQTSEGAASR